jgi:hypothetical protein
VINNIARAQFGFSSMFIAHIIIEGVLGCPILVSKNLLIEKIRDL